VSLIPLEIEIYKISLTRPFIIGVVFLCSASASANLDRITSKVHPLHQINAKGVSFQPSYDTLPRLTFHEHESAQFATTAGIPLNYKLFLNLQFSSSQVDEKSGQHDQLRLDALHGGRTVRLLMNHSTIGELIQTIQSTDHLIWNTYTQGITNMDIGSNDNSTCFISFYRLYPRDVEKRAHMPVEENISDDVLPKYGLFFDDLDLGKKLPVSIIMSPQSNSDLLYPTGMVIDTAALFSLNESFVPEQYISFPIIYTYFPSQTKPVGSLATDESDPDMTRLWHQLLNIED